MRGFLDFSAFDMLSVGILAIDTNERITYLNRAYADFLESGREELLGRHIRQVIPHTNLDHVAKTGVPEVGVWQKTKKGYLFGNRLPIIENGKVTGALAELVIQDFEDLDAASKKLCDMEAQIKYLTKKLINIEINKNNQLVFESDQMKDIVEKVKKVAPLDTTILITGETGTGKEVIADLIYQHSNRSRYPFIKINCSAMPIDLIESELFGYEKGAFTGANQKGKVGKFELADKGVLFLDEISTMPLAMQSKLLRVLQEKEIECLGSNVKKKIDVKIVAATNESLNELVKQQKFRQDLFYRLNVIRVDIPPLRQRREDIMLLCNYFLERYYHQLNKTPKTLTYTAVQMLKSYDWPGNVRELKNVMERLAIMCDGTLITQTDIKENTPIGSNDSMTGTLKDQMDENEKNILETALKKTGGNKVKTARILGINRTTLYSKLLKYHLDEIQ